MKIEYDPTADVPKVFGSAGEGEDVSFYPANVTM